MKNRNAQIKNSQETLNYYPRYSPPNNFPASSSAYSCRAPCQEENEFHFISYVSDFATTTVDNRQIDACQFPTLVA